METAFWTCLFIVFYTYIGYGIILWCCIHIKRIMGPARPQLSLPEDTSLWPEVTLMVCAYNEQDVVDMKMENTRQIDYPKDKLHMLWVTDGSTDKTNERLSRYRGEADILFQPERQGKTAALNRGVSHATTGIIIMTDANTRLNPDAVKEIVKQFEDSRVSCVAGEKRVMARNGNQSAAQGEGVYWKYESTLKRWDAELYSAMGCAGELCAIRKELYRPMPKDTLLDDFIMSMQTLRQGYRIAYTDKAYAMEYGSASIEEEAKRKKRIAAGGLQSIWRLRPLMNVFRYPIVSFQFISHRILRWSVTPFALLALIPLNVTLVMQQAGTVYVCTWVLQLLFYAAAFAGYVLDARGGVKISALYIAYYFLFMNTNVFRGINYLIKHKGNGTWEKARRG